MKSINELMEGKGHIHELIEENDNE